MPNVISIVLAFFVLIQSLGLNPSSFAQLDELWNHYQEHKVEYGDSFLTFLDLHYGSQQQEHQDEHPEHRDLPLQHCTHFHFTYFIKAEDFSFEIHYQIAIIEHNFIYKANFQSLLETDILQPPKSLV
jgi:hypothetical protein